MNISQIGAIAQMNKQELAGVLAAIEQRKKEIEEESLKKSSLLQHGNCAVLSDCVSGFSVHSFGNIRICNNSFQDSDTAQAYAEAFNTMLGLRHCKGSVKAAGRVYQYTIDSYATVIDYTTITNKSQLISPCYATEQDAINAIETVGKDAIIKMFNTFSGN